MKKYTKPAIGFESFFLSSSIADVCEITSLTDPKLQLPGVGNIFTSIDNCGYQTNLGSDGTSEYTGLAGDGSYNTICYHNPTGVLNMFNS